MNQAQGRQPRIVVAVTGASGALYPVRFLRQAAPQCSRIDLIFSPNALSVAATELGAVMTRPYTTAQYLDGDYPSVHFLSPRDFFTPPASGSYDHDGMVIVPCSMGTAGRIAHGISDDLTTRAADVCLKEKRPLILVARETPLNLIHLRNLTQLAEAGATILPAAPAFYHKPHSVEDLVDTVVARILQHLGLAQTIVPAWQHNEQD
jgi:4-hydroxy-3-polyprenylbenzoate decarboxylase